MFVTIHKILKWGAWSRINSLDDFFFSPFDHALLSFFVVAVEFHYKWFFFFRWHSNTLWISIKEIIAVFINFFFFSLVFLSSFFFSQRFSFFFFSQKSKFNPFLKILLYILHSPVAPLSFRIWALTRKCFLSLPRLFGVGGGYIFKSWINLFFSFFVKCNLSVFISSWNLFVFIGHNYLRGVNSCSCQFKNVLWFLWNFPFWHDV